MNAPVRIRDCDGGQLMVRCDTSACTVAVGAKSARVSATVLVMVALLAKAYPNTVPRDRMMAKVFAGNRAQRDPATCLRQTMTRARERLKPLGLTILYTPNPGGSDLPGFYALGPYTGRGA